MRCLCMFPTRLMFMSWFNHGKSCSRLWLIGLIAGNPHLERIDLVSSYPAILEDVRVRATTTPPQEVKRASHQPL